MQTYCSVCKKHTNNICPIKLVMKTSKKIKGKSRCADSLGNKSFSGRISTKVIDRLLCPKF